MRAMDVMTTDVITVDPSMSVQGVAQLLSERGISGVPVVDAANRLVGIVSEGDLLHRVETGTERRPQRPAGRRSSWWLDTIGSPQELARDYLKSHGRTAEDVMTREVISVADTTELADVAMLLETKRIKRVPVCATASSSVLSAGRTSCGPWRRRRATRRSTRTATTAPSATSCSPS